MHTVTNKLMVLTTKKTDLIYGVVSVVPFIWLLKRNSVVNMPGLLVVMMWDNHLLFSFLSWKHTPTLFPWLIFVLGIHRFNFLPDQYKHTHLSHCCNFFFRFDCRKIFNRKQLEPNEKKCTQQEENVSLVIDIVRYCSGRNRLPTLYMHVFTSDN